MRAGAGSAGWAPPCPATLPSRRLQHPLLPCRPSSWRVAAGATVRGAGRGRAAPQPALRGRTGCREGLQNGGSSGAWPSYFSPGSDSPFCSPTKGFECISLHGINLQIPNMLSSWFGLIFLRKEASSASQAGTAVSAG